ncbi:MAG: PQQ-binding-like beta-propeller repeat protein [Rhodothermia bacterium]
MKFFAIATFVLISSGSWAQPVSRLDPVDPKDGIFFGWTVTTDPSGTILAVAAPSAASPGVTAGRVDLYEAGGAGWDYVTSLTGSDTIVGDDFGSDVAFSSTESGLYLLVGARDHDAAGVDEGAVYVFTEGGDGWKQIDKLLPPDTEAGDAFGRVIDAEGSRVIVGAHYWNASTGSDKGAAYIYEFDGDAFVLDATLTADVAVNDFFAESVALVADWALVGAYQDGAGDASFAGVVFAYKRVAPHEWSPRQQISAPVPLTGAGFGVSMDAAFLDAPTAVIGAYRDDDGRGSSYIVSLQNNEWIHRAKLQAGDRTNKDWFGSSVSMIADPAESGAGIVAVGARRKPMGTDQRTGAAFRFEGAGTKWTETLKLQPVDAAPFSEIGYSVALDPDHLIAGAPYTPNNDQVGAAYSVFYGVIKNEPPVARSDWGFGSNDNIIVIDVLANDSDADGDPLEVVSTGSASNGTAKIVGNKVLFTPEAGFVGEAEFAYVVQDDKGATDEGSVRVILTDPKTLLFITTDDEEPSDDPEVFRSRKGSINPELFFETPIPDFEVLTLNLFDDVTLVVRRERLEQTDETSYSWFGVGPRRTDQVMLEIDPARRSILGTIWVNGFPFMLRKVDDNVFMVLEINPAGFLDETSLEPPEPGSGGGKPLDVIDGTFRGVPDIVSPETGKSSTAEIDLLILYTTQATASAGLPIDMVDQIRNAVNLMNQTFRNSGVDARVRLAGSAQVAYSETGDSGDDLDNLRSDGQDSSSDIAKLRRRTRADIVGLVVSDFEACGRGALMTKVDTDHGEKAYFVVEEGNCLGANLSFAHEIGHILAARHDRFVDNKDGSPFNYNHGYVNPFGNWSSGANQWRTVMAYNDRCEDGPMPSTYTPLLDTDGNPFCSRLPFWSDPDSTLLGHTRGIASGSNAADNVRTLENTVSTGENFVGSLPAISGSVLDAATGQGLFDTRMLGSDGSSTRTDSAGYYVLFVQPGDSLTVTPDFLGYTFVPPSLTFNNVTKDRTADFTGFEMFEVSGKVTFRPTGAGLSGIEMRGVTGVVELTGAFGDYSIRLPWGWSGRIAPNSREYTFTPPAIELNTLTADTIQDFSAVRNRYIVSGLIRELNGTPVPDVELKGFPDPIVTNSGGFYEIEIEHGWSGVVTPVKAGFDLDPFSRKYINLSGPRDHDYDAYPGALARSAWPVFGADARNTGAIEAPTAQSQIRWSTIVNGRIAPPVVAADGTVVVGTDKGFLVGFDAQGTRVWEVNTTFIAIDASPVVGSGGIVYVAESDLSGRLSAFSYIDRDVKWMLPTGGPIVASPTIGEDGTVYVGNLDGDLVAVGSSGVEQWRFSAGGDIRSSPALAEDGTIYFGSDDGRVYALNADGTQKWSFATGDMVRSAPTVGGDGVVYVGSDDDNVYAIRPSGAERWRASTGGDVRSSGAIDSNGNIYFGSADSLVHAFSPTGARLWTFAATSPISTGLAISYQKIRRFTREVDEEVLYVADDAGTLHALNIVSLSSSADRLKWTRPIVGFGTSGPVLTGDGLVIGGLGDPGTVTYLKPQSLALTQGIILLQDAGLTEREVAIAIWISETGGPLGLIGDVPGEDPCAGGPLIIPNCPFEGGGFFGDVSPYVSLVADEDLLIGLIDAAADIDAVVSGRSTEGLLGTFPLRFSDQEVRPIIVAGLLDKDGFAENPDGRSIEARVFSATALSEQLDNPESVVVVAGHFSTDAGEMQITLDGPTSESFVGMRYGEISEARLVPPGVYDVVIDLPNTPGKRWSETKYRLDLSGRVGEVVSVLATGFANPDANKGGPALGLVTAGVDEAVLPVPISETSPELPEQLRVIGAYPDPFSVSTTIQYVLPGSGHVSIELFDVRGRKIRTFVDRIQQAGLQSVTVERGNLPSGLYLYRVITGAGSANGRMMVVR